MSDSSLEQMPEWARDVYGSLPLLLSVKEAAKLLGRSGAFVRMHIAQQRLVAVKMGTSANATTLIPRLELVRFLVNLPTEAPEKIQQPPA